MEVHQINEVSFADYHRFGSSSQITTGSPAQ
jgi:hypothetical protein